MADGNESLQAIIRKAATKDLESAVNYAVREWSRSPDYAEWVSELVRKSLRAMIHDSRHTTNIALRKAAGEYGQPSKVGSGVAVSAAASMSLLDSYSIAGRRIGDILGAELSGIAADCRANAAGNIFNARLCESLRKIVSEDKPVRECVTETRFKKLFSETQNRGAA